MLIPNRGAHPPCAVGARKTHGLKFKLKTIFGKLVNKDEDNRRKF